MWRSLWYVFLVAIGVVITPIQLDRHSIEAPALAAFVPAFVADFSKIRPTAISAVDGSSTEVASDAARILYNHPIPSEYLTIYALALSRLGNDSVSSEAISLSAQRGWREPIAQRAVALAAAQSKDWDVAADRLAALWKTSPGQLATRSLSKKLLAVPEIRSDFAKKIVGQSYWIDAFVSWSADNLQVDAFVEVMSIAQRAGAEIDCIQLSAIGRKMLGSGRLDGPAKLWNSHCGKDLPDLGKSYSFQYYGVGMNYQNGPFAWFYPKSAGLSTSIRNRSGAQHLHYVNSEPFSQLLARKYLSLPAGEYRFSADVQSDSSLVSPLRAIITCVTRNKDHQIVVLRKLNSVKSAQFSIPDVNCPVQILQLRVEKGRGTISDLEIHRVN